MRASPERLRRNGAEPPCNVNSAVIRFPSSESLPANVWIAARVGKLTNAPSSVNEVFQRQSVQAFAREANSARVCTTWPAGDINLEIECHLGRLNHALPMSREIRRAPRRPHRTA